MRERKDERRKIQGSESREEIEKERKVDKKRKNRKRRIERGRKKYRERIKQVIERENRKKRDSQRERERVNNDKLDESKTVLLLSSHFTHSFILIHSFRFFFLDVCNLFTLKNLETITFEMKKKKK